MEILDKVSENCKGGGCTCWYGIGCNTQPLTIASFIPEEVLNPFRASQRCLSPESGACSEKQGRNIEMARAISASNIRNRRTQTDLCMADYTEHNVRLIQKI